MLEIHGAGFHNKGAELMLRATISELRGRWPEVELAIDPYYGSYVSRSELQLYQVFPSRTHVGTKQFSRCLLRQKMFSFLRGEFVIRLLGMDDPRNFGCISPSGLQGMLDISGFAYTDQWGSKPVKDFARLARYYYAQKKPVVLLPQAFGPFEQVESKDAIKDIIDHIDFLYARDFDSYKFIEDVVGPSERIRIAPDITLFYPRQLERRVVKGDAYACVVPNVRMVDQGGKLWGDKYLNFVTAACRHLLMKDLEVRIIIHDTTGGDQVLARRLMANVRSRKLSIVAGESAVSLKETIAGSLLMVGSRYHSLVAAFSGGVPAIGFGWSHKYKALFRDFGCKSFLVTPEKTLDELIDCLDVLLDADVNRRYRLAIGQHLESMVKANREMWRNIIDILRSRID